jgi:Ca2+-binding RTX toxin-like protein
LSILVAHSGAKRNIIFGEKAMSKRTRKFFQAMQTKRSEQRRSRLKRRRLQLEKLSSRQLLACDLMLNPDADPGDVYQVCAVLTGTPESEKLQGFDSNDTDTGGGGADLFPFTMGNDVITDFNPNEDMIDVGDFARASDDFATLTSFADSQGTVSLVIDVDGSFGNATTTLTGVNLSDLDSSNVFFGLDGESIPPLEFTHIAEFVVTYSNCDIYLFLAHDLSNHPTNGQLVSSGDCNNPDGEDPNGEDPDDDEEAVLVTVNVPADSGTINIELDQGNVVLRSGGEVLTETPLESANTLVIVGSESNDKIRLNLRGEDAAQLTPVTVYGGDGNDNIMLKAVVTAFNGELTIFGDDGNDKLRAIAAQTPVLLGGGDGNDRLHGGQSDDHLIGGAGDNRLFGLDGDDFLDGGEGADRLLAGNGNDWLSGGTGDDLINGGEGDDTLFETIAADIVLTNRRMTGLGTDRIRGLETAEFAVMDNAEVDGKRFSGSINLDPIDADFETDD